MAAWYDPCQTKKGLRPRPYGARNCSEELLLTRVAYHLHVRNLQMPVLGVVLPHASIFLRVLGIFFKVMRCRIRNHAGCGDCVAHVTREVYAALATPHLPRAAIISGQQELVGTVAFG